MATSSYDGGSRLWTWKSRCSLAARNKGDRAACNVTHAAKVFPSTRKTMHGAATPCVVLRCVASGVNAIVGGSSVRSRLASSNSILSATSAGTLLKLHQAGYGSAQEMKTCSSAGVLELLMFWINYRKTSSVAVRLILQGYRLDCYIRQKGKERVNEAWFVSL